MQEEIFIVGVGMTPFGKQPQKSFRQLTAEAVGLALADAGCDVSAIEAVWFGNVGQGALENQQAVRGQIALSAAGIEGIPVINVENACASASTAIAQAATYLRAGQGEVVLAVGCEKMCVEDKQRIFDLFEGCWDVHNAQANLAGLKDVARNLIPAANEEAERNSARSVFMDIYAGLARDHMQRFGTTQRHIAHVAAKNHFHSTLNPLSQYRQDMSVDEVLAGRPVSWPLTLPMCSPVSDGAAAAVICTKSALARFNRKRAVKLMASVIAAGRKRSLAEYDQHICHVAAKRAYDIAGIGPQDISVAEVHDASAFAEILQTENLMFCELGAGGLLAESGATKLGGRIPVNTSGGLESKGHPIGATGLAQVHELVMQLRGEAGPRQVPGARFAIAENGGGFLGVEEAAACITILGRGT
ncbi:MAG: thiolase family protein [Panacagrimonas sp.]